MSLRAAALAALVLAAAGCGGSAVVTAESLSSCLAGKGVETAPRGDPDADAETEVLAFEIRGSPPARGLLIIVDDADYAAELDADIRAEARDLGSVAHTVQERNVIAHFLTARPPAEREREPIRACLED